ncbi:hypothetical protein HB364_23620 [Pseudoflavitalea sp. X16]|nr:hypothetical protein [Paraflavitalea devenefica]
MLRNVMIITGLFFYTGILHAQDTSYNFLTERFGQQYDFYSKEVISQPLLQLHQYARVEGGYRYTSGDYRLSQDAPKQQDIFFYTEGTKRINKFLVSGSFSYQHTNQDSVGYTLRYGLHDAAPYYFYAAAKGNWEIGEYRLQGIISHPLLDDKLTVGAGGTYHAGNAWRSNDPRPDYFFYDVQAQATIHYCLLPRHTIGVAGGIARKNTDSEIDFRNDNYEQSLLYEQFQTYMQYGYGFAQLISGSRYVRSKGSGWDIQGIYDGQFNRLHVTAKGGYASRSSVFSRRGERTSLAFKYGEFYEDIINAAILGEYSQGNNSWTTGIYYLYHTGQDMHTILNGNNYMYTFDRLSIEPLYTRRRDGKVRYELGVQGTVSNLFQADGSASQKINYQYADADLSGAYYHYLPAADTYWKAFLKVGARLPLSPELTTSSQQTTFAKGVIYPDYYYYSASSVTATAAWQYNFPVKKTNTFLKLSGQYQQASIKQDHDYPAIAKPGNNRWYIQTSIGISL